MLCFVIYSANSRLELAAEIVWQTSLGRTQGYQMSSGRIDLWICLPDNLIIATREANFSLLKVPLLPLAKELTPRDDERWCVVGRGIFAPGIETFRIRWYLVLLIYNGVIILAWVFTQVQRLIVVLSESWSALTRISTQLVSENSFALMSSCHVVQEHVACKLSIQIRGKFLGERVIITRNQSSTCLQLHK